MKRFVSADPIYSKIKEELSSYFGTGAVDDFMFPVYTEQILKKLRKSSLPVRECVITVKNNQGDLPQDFNSVKELWATRELVYEYPAANYHYYQKDYRLEDITSKCGCTQEDLPCDKCDPCNKERMVVHRVNTTHLFSYKYSHLLQPGNLQAKGCCDSSSPNLNVSCSDTFDISGCSLMTSFKEGIVHLLYYSNGLSEDGDEQLIPDDVWVQELIEKYIRFKIFDKLWNMSTDDSFAQSKLRRDVAQDEYYNAKTIAETELKRESKQTTKIRTEKTQNRNNAYYRMLGMGRR